MRSGKATYLIIVFSIAFCACKKEVTETHPEMEGYWMTAAYGPGGGKIIEINGGKNSTYITYDGFDKSDEKTGPAKIKGSTLKIGSAKLNVDIFPCYDASGNYEMVVDNETFYKTMSPEITSIISSTDHVTVLFIMGHNSTNSHFQGSAESYDMQYKTDTSSTWITVNNWIYPTIGGLASATNYQCRLKANYPWGGSEYSPVTTFSTL